MHASRIALPLALLSLGLAACGGDDKKTTSSTSSSATTSTVAPGAKYPAEVEKNFLDACNKSSKGKTDACKCALAKLEETVSFDEFKQADSDIRAGKEADSKISAKINSAIKSCA